MNAEFKEYLIDTGENSFTYTRLPSKPCECGGRLFEKVCVGSSLSYSYYLKSERETIALKPFHNYEGRYYGTKCSSCGKWMHKQEDGEKKVV